MPVRLHVKMVVGALLLVVAASQPAVAQKRGFSATDLPIVMTAYVEAVIDMRAAYEKCSPEDKRPSGWDEGAALLIESLKGAGISASVASMMQARLAAPIVPAAADCASEQVMLYSGVPAGKNWPDYHRVLLGLNEIRIVEPAVQDARLDRARAVVEEALPKQKRMLVCLSLFDPQNFLAAFTDWNGLVSQAAQALIGAGLGADAYGPFLDGALSRALYAVPSDRAAAAADCMANQDWMERFSTFAWYSFSGDVESALKDGQP